MNTAIICFNNGNEYIKIKQISRILNEENEERGILCEDYDDLEFILPKLYEANIKNIIILHGSENLDRFEQLIHNEYDHMFEFIEICEDSSYEHLYEADQQTQAAQTAQSGGIAKVGVDPNDRTIAIMFPLNPLVQNSKSFSNIANKIFQIAENDDIVLFDYSSLSCDKDGAWGMSSILNSSLMKGFKKCSEQTAFVRTAGGLIRIYPGIQHIIMPQYLISSFTGGQNQILNQNKKVTFNDSAVMNSIGNLQLPNFNPVQLGTQAFAIGSKIMSEQKSVKINDSKVKEWQDQKRINRAGFLVKCLSDIAWAAQNKGKNEATKDGKSFANQVLKQFGFYDDLAAINKNAREGGLGLVADAVALVADKLSQKKEKQQSKTAPIISHPDFDKFADCFDKDDNLYVEGD